MTAGYDHLPIITIPEGPDRTHYEIIVQLVQEAIADGSINQAGANVNVDGYELLFDVY